jgi:dynein heavy chain
MKSNYINDLTCTENLFYHFCQVFNSCIASTASENAEELEERLRVLKKETTYATYVNISRGLFEKDKLVFSFMLCTDVMRSRGGISDEEWNFFLRGGVGVEGGRTKKPGQASWINAQQWNNICDLESTFDFMQDFSMDCLEQAIKIKIGSFKYVSLP